MDLFQVHWIQKVWPCGKLLSDAVCCCDQGGVSPKRNWNAAAAAKRLFNSQWSTAWKGIILFILPPFLIWHRFCHSSFSPHLSSSFAFYLFCLLLFFLCGKCNGFLGSEWDILSQWTIITRVRATSCSTSHSLTNWGQLGIQSVYQLCMCACCTWRWLDLWRPDTGYHKWVNSTVSMIKSCLFHPSIYY